MSGSSSSSSSSSPTKASRPHRLAPPPSFSPGSSGSASSTLHPHPHPRPTSPRPPPRSPRSSPLMSPSLFPPAPPPLHLSIRFSKASLADLQLDILHPHQTTVVALKHLIRARLAETEARDAPDVARGRLRFIHAGKILPDGSVLSAVLKPLPPPPPAKGEKGKGVEGRVSSATQRVYINCSIGDVLSDEDLAAEAKAAVTPAPSPGPAEGSGYFGAASGGASGGGLGISSGVNTGSSASGGVRPTAAGAAGGAAAAAPAPRGFDRLLQAGFTRAEVNQLRLQFRSIQASRHTPDTMPSPDTLRNMEDAWIDNNSANPYANGGGGGGAAGDGEFGDGSMDETAGMVSLLDAIIKGMVVGFMFPLGTVGWLVRQDAMWSRRWRMFASLGFVLSLCIGMIRSLAGER